MFIDLSGFTPLTEALMRRGSRGAEKLSETLNEIFAPLVRLVYARGGLIPYFAGDAFTAIFPVDRPGVSPEEFLKSAMAVRDLFSRRQYRFASFTIGLKIGLSYGEVEWGIVGKTHKSFYFRGRPIDSCAQSQTRASNQEIILDEALKRQLENLDVELESVEAWCYRLNQLPAYKKLHVEPATLPDLNRATLRHFLPLPVIEYRQEGEFRTVISVFISFDGVETHESLDQFAGIVLEQIHNFSGYFKEIDFGDKGGVMVAFFGAPVSFENNIDRALEFVYTLRAELRELQLESGLKFRASLTTGTAYTGIVGGKERCQYAAVGNRVNLAARLMTYADWGEILIDDEIQKNRHYIFHHKGDIHYKGIKGPVPTFKLIGRNYEFKTAHTGNMVGREAELKQLFEFSQPVLNHQPAGVAIIYGEAGIGKSRLSFELREKLMEQGELEWFLCQADQILRKPFNPFVYFLKNYFEQSPDSSLFDNLMHFEERFRHLVESLEALTGEGPATVLKELHRTKTVLAALVGIFYKESLWKQLDAKGRYQNTLLSINNLFIAESLLQPIIIELEDGHWLDDNSGELVQELVRQIKHYPILLLVTSRYNDDGSKPMIVDSQLFETYELPRLEIDLNYLQPESVRIFAENTLQGKISQNFHELLIRTTNSNPFYLEQLLEYFIEREMLIQKDGLWNVRDQNIRLSSSIHAVLTARIDRLSSLVKETVKAAAVIGREFELPILTEVMKGNEEFSKLNDNSLNILKEQISKAERGQIWLAMNELRYIFRHSLLREAAYTMQLRARLQQLHHLIAEAIENLYGDKIEERYVDLAFHYEQAGVLDKTCEYLRKAADYARRNYQNQQALEFYEKLLEKLSANKEISNQIKTHLKRGKILEMIGHWDQCQEAYQLALKLAKKSRDALLLAQVHNNLGRLLTLRGNYTQARNYLEMAVQLFESVDDQRGIANVYGNLGNLFFREGKYEEAKSFFTESISLEQGVKNSPTVNAQIVANLGLTYMNQGDYDEGIRVQQEKLDICKKQNDKQGMAILYTYLGIVYLEKGDYDAALESFHNGFDYSEELGNKQLTSIAIGNIGLVYERQGDYDRAMENYELDLKLCEEMGDKQGTAIALNLIGQLLNVKGEFHKAIEYLQKDLMLCEELGYQKGIAKAVNTLGDVFFFSRQYERSLYFYNRAIEVTRKIGNKLVLGFSLAEKGAVLIALNRREELEQVCREAMKLSRELGNPDLLFEAQLLNAKVRFFTGNAGKAIDLLTSLLNQDLAEDQEAATYYELSHFVPANEAYTEKALVIYQRLYQATPRFVYKRRIQELQEEKRD